MSRSIGLVAMSSFLLATGPTRADDFLDLGSVTPGSIGTGAFSGTLGSVTVSGSITSGALPVFSFNAAGVGIGNSTLGGTSPQFSYASVFSPTIASTDRVGFTSAPGATNVMTITFGSPVTNPVFHIANLDMAQFSFLGSPGLTGLTLLNSNTGAGDGLDPTFGGAPFGSSVVQDLNISSSDGTLPTSPPPTTGARSAYGSVQLNGTLSSIVVGIGAGPLSDDGCFTLSVAPVPEPGMVTAALFGMLGVAGCLRRTGRPSDSTSNGRASG